MVKWRIWPYTLRVAHFTFCFQIEIQHTNSGKDPNSRPKYTSTTRIITFTAKDVPGGRAPGFHSQGAGFESTRPILSGIFNGLTRSLQTSGTANVGYFLNGIYTLSQEYLAG